MKDQDGFKDKMFWMVNGSQIVILTLSIISCLIGFWQIPKLAVSSTKPLELDRLLLSCTIVGAYIFAIFGMIVGGLYFHDQMMLTIFCTNGLLFLQVNILTKLNLPTVLSIRNNTLFYCPGDILNIDLFTCGMFYIPIEQLNSVFKNLLCHVSNSNKN